MYQFCDLKTIILCFVNLKLELRENQHFIHLECIYIAYRQQHYIYACINLAFKNYNFVFCELKAGTPRNPRRDFQRQCSGSSTYHSNSLAGDNYDDNDYDNEDTEKVVQ